ncbi:hypothetical protein [Bacillus wiedmannii]|uniref:hypothetical protein n=1 Tax=Bacillus wiedmannii TaxID=1890302 RepID=UPI001C54C5F4|nr:hypothetical protein [Bacillus wiedmannii]
MVSTGVSKIDKSDGWDDNGLHIEIHEFGNVDPKFMDFLYSENLIDSDRAEDQDFFVIKEGV